MSNFHLSDILTSHDAKLTQTNTRYMEDVFIGIVYDLSVLDYIAIPHYACLVCTKGRASVSINMENYDICEGVMIIKFDINVLIHNGHTEDFEARCVIFSNDCYRQLTSSAANYRSIFLAQKLPNVFRLDERARVGVMLTIDHLSFVIEYLHDRYMIRAVSSCVGTFGKIVFQMIQEHIYRGEIAHRRFSRADSIFKAFIELVIEDHHRHRSVKHYADRLSVTPKHLAEVVKRVSHRRASEWIDSYVISEAKALLLSSDKPIYEVADELHFESATLFSRYFLRLTSITPRAFREEHTHMHYTGVRDRLLRATR